MRKIWINKANSFKAAQKFDVSYYLSMHASDRLETMQLLRDWYFKIKKGLRNESRKGLRRAIKIIQ
jgi:hypothetical protein